ncbi:receptor-like protein 12 [Prunus avium]|uniref:Receptor-like protein 12 n=1 Tax=Prunus avium TaxID=42229 RepID=A0A6P5TPN5_PRUAV|nr:receptor-like protein 12 [Prunus avium]
MNTLLHYLFLLCFIILLPAVHSQCIKDQQQSLLHLKKSLQFDPPSWRTPLIISWNSSTDCCSWGGVTCTSNGHVVGLDLSFEGSFANFSTPRVLDLSSNNISGPIPGSFANFPNLRELDLSGNPISDPIPGFFANFSKLTSLSLSNCQLNGTFPKEIFQVPTLQTIDLSDNSKLGGSLPDFPENNGSLLSLILRGTNFSGSLPDSIGNLKILSWIDLSYCNFYGSIPSSFFSLPFLLELNLAHNQFSGELVFSNVSSDLSTLDLSFNHLDGQIPVSIFNFRGLESLQLSSNNFSGFPFNGPQQVKYLTNIDLSYNSLLSLYNGTDSSYSSFPEVISLNLAANKLRTIPYFLRNQSTLSSLSLSENHIQGKIPHWIWSSNQLDSLNLSCNSLATLEPHLYNSTVKTVDLHSNQLQGQIPTFLPFAKYLDYSRNNFRSIPSNIGDFLTNTLFFSLSSNNLHGLIPTSICNSQIQILDMSNNSLSGMIPQCLTAIRDISVLNLARNNLTGTISNVEVSENSSLEILEFATNRLGGQVPKSLAKCTKLKVLNMGNNNITDTFPCLLKSISTLRVLVVRSNNFYGGIECLNTNVTWPGLQIIDLAHNNFRGEIQGILWRTWQKMMVTEDGSLLTINGHYLRRIFNPFVPNDGYGLEEVSLGFGYDISTTVTNKGSEMNLVKILSIFTLIDFSCNNFSGPIPKEMGEFKSLRVLNLSKNAFTGEIPSSFGNMSTLECLDLSLNKLSGRNPITNSTIFSLNGIRTFVIFITRD